MKIALFGANGMIGQRIAREATERGHQVTAIVRNPSSFTECLQNLSVAQGDASDPESVAKVAAGHDLVVSALGPAHGALPESFVEMTRTLIDGVKRTGVQRLIAVGGAGSLEVAPGVQLMDTPEFPSALQGIARAHHDALNLYLGEKDLDWTNISPAALIEPGQRTGKYRTGKDQLVTNDKGESRISAEDFAIAIIDEVEKPRFSRQRFTAAY
ncbi:NAD(P)-dependent oxidoreductase [Ktedonobacter racemifer]|uniref:Saccharopine dehydrogenase n=1 Tax=Ktedonobacter racemifer DSM 44963 TaxID=485913 RepID=D6TVP8_KTERA|nr:NAD(P)-dependent oxidoreductase [Ktedonobacter racemifer]EFH84281.1 Saccharopine dehydrogenase [Ktedonobacter racemifer DSM 44963]